ncbi:MAG: metalloregulator ArsR/SmtB family transcription factor [Gammaproteobacteria bacterium]|nr:metalloregulator ArsR/SmtB family transcription factor [Gammaproteobacteria bacterium]
MKSAQVRIPASAIGNTSESGVVSVYPLQAGSSEVSLLDFCKASADQLRLDILRVLSRDSFGVLELCRIFDSKQSSISHHLKILSNSGLVLRRREGNSIFYHRALSYPGERAGLAEFSKIKKELFQVIDSQTISDSVKKRLIDIQQERAESSASFFRENSDKFQAQQEQVAAYELYGPNIRNLISSSLDELIKKHGTVLEVGPGEGEFLVELSQLFGQVIALDNSEEMLTKAQKLASSQKLTNIGFIKGDTSATGIESYPVDCVVMNMVLHHTPSPADVFYDIAKVLDIGGQLFITELCSHDQPWVKDSCGDLWLGFDPKELGDWAHGAGFKEGESIYLAQRNGFRVQLRQFIKKI